jgi:hypothetical protein
MVFINAEEVEKINNKYNIEHQRKLNEMKLELTK